MYRIKIVTTESKTVFTSSLSALNIRNLINTGSMINYIDDDDKEEVNLFVHPNQLVTITDRLVKTTKPAPVEDTYPIRVEGFNSSDSITVITE